MAVRVQCACGRALAVNEGLAGRRVRCPGCGQTVLVPPGDAPEDFTPYGLKSEPAAAPGTRTPLPAEAPAPLRPRPEGECYRCGAPVKGKPYQFLAGSQSTALRGNRVEVGATYRDMARHDLYLCRRCAETLWQRKYLLEVLGWSIPAVVLPRFVPLSTSQPSVPRR
jgi:hypothetical protein